MAEGLKPRRDPPARHPASSTRGPCLPPPTTCSRPTAGSPSPLAGPSHKATSGPEQRTRPQRGPGNGRRHAWTSGLRSVPADLVLGGGRRGEALESSKRQEHSPAVSHQVVVSGASPSLNSAGLCPHPAGPHPGHQGPWARGTARGHEDRPLLEGLEGPRGPGCTSWHQAASAPGVAPALGTGRCRLAAGGQLGSVPLGCLFAPQRVAALGSRGGVSTHFPPPPGSDRAARQTCPVPWSPPTRGDDEALAPPREA